MKNNEVIRIAIAESSVIIRSGLSVALKRLPSLKVQSVELGSIEALNDCLRSQPIDILIVSPNFGNYFDVLRFKESPIGKGISVIALVSTFIDASVLSKYDDLTQKEIATIMQSTEGSVEQLLQRAKSNLQKKLSPMVGK
ncbi:MAG TPA: sigma factor-like helix-turn-helix DNA-binding protein [Bacteroides graminisolvens]|nr:sigma factor-like helix-turn-helix DNA-binding protein [Bacteroides graminisolvens]